jgi:hypothetical protein
MAASSGFMIAEAERRFPVRVRIGVPPDGLGSRLDRIKVWLDESCGADGWAMTPSGTRGVLNDALSIYFADATPASAFVASWCASYQVETSGGVFQVREDEPVRQVRASLHGTPLGVRCLAYCSNAADKPSKTRTIPTLALTLPLDPAVHGTI